MKIKLKQIRNSLEHQDSDVAELVNDICEKIEIKYKKEEESCNFCISKDNSVYKKIKRVIGIFNNFDIDIIEFRDSEKQVIYSVYFYEE